MLHWKKLAVAAVAVAAVALAPTAGAAVNLAVVAGPDSVTGSFAVQAAGWRPTGCEGVGYDASWRELPARAYTETLDGQIAWMAWSDWTPEVVHATFSCDVYRTQVTYPLRWRWFTKARSGTNTSSRSNSSSCYLNRSYYPSSLHLDCWGGAYAQATYGFSLPRDARRITRRIATEAGCCTGHGGYTSKRWSGNTAVVRATGWTSIYVKRVSVTYQHRVKTRVVTRVEGWATGRY